MSNTFKAIVSNLDGTLIGRDKTMSPKLQTAISSLAEKNIAFSIATGRAYEAIAPFVSNCR